MLLPFKTPRPRKRGLGWLSMTVIASRLVIGVATVFVSSPTMSEDVGCTAQKNEHRCSMLYQLHDGLSIAMQLIHDVEI